MTPSSQNAVTEGTSFAATFSADQLIHILNAEVTGSPGRGAGSISTDTRSIQPGQWYLALKGETFDGHKFIDNAIKAGAAGCIVSEIPDGIKSGAVLFKVRDTLKAYHAIARAWLKQVDPFVIGVTGSSGKTTTKEMCAAVVSSRPSHKSRANENNEFGLPKTILSMPPDTEVVVIEMAMRGLKQIALLAATATPDAGIITCAGTAHIELLGSEENIIKAKCEIFEEMHNQGLAIIGNPTYSLEKHAKSVFKGQFALFSKDHVQETDVSMERTRFKVRGFKTEFEVHAHGIRHIQDAWCAVVAGRAAGLSDEQIAEGLKSYRSVEGRGNKLVTESGAVIIDESYNANPDSVKCAVEAVLNERAYPQSNKYIVLGEMAELGENTDLMHEQTGEWLKHQKFSALLTVGAKAKIIADAAREGGFDVVACADQSEALSWLQPKLSKEACVMIKGSHCANLDKLVSNLTSR